MNKNFALGFAAIVIAISVSTTRAPSSGNVTDLDTSLVDDTASSDIPGTAPASAQAAQTRSDAVVLQREADGHFYADAQVNGTTIRFMVDTGASSVALSQADAQRAGMYFTANDFNEVGRGAGGDIALRPVTFDRIAVGNIEAKGVRGVVIGGDADMSLLGQSFLSTLGGVSIEGDTMVLRPA